MGSMKMRDKWAQKKTQKELRLQGGRVGRREVQSFAAQKNKKILFQ